jgi:hypothetical protein
VNLFEGALRYDLDEVREALGVRRDVPIMECDARRRQSVKEVLLTLIDVVLFRTVELVSSTNG